MIISLIVAMDNKRGIGKDNQTPWHISSDLKRFKKLTMGHHIVMGRKTYESIGRALPGRKMIVLSGRPDFEIEDGVLLHTLEDALRYAEERGESELFITGGGEIFDQSIKYADRIYLTAVDATVDADVFFPQYDEDEWEPICSELIDLRNGEQFAYQFQILVRRRDIKDQESSSK